MGKPVPPLSTPLVSSGSLITADPWQKYFTNLYREGTWTPTIGGSAGTSGQSYSVQYGRYIKEGRKATAACLIVLATKGTITGNVIVGGLPFVAERQPLGRWVASVGYFSLATAWASVMGVLQGGMREITLFAVPPGGAVAPGPLTTADISNSSVLILEISYLAQD
jgi:hypothetical protein